MIQNSSMVTLSYFALLSNISGGAVDFDGVSYGVVITGLTALSSLSIDFDCYRRQPASCGPVLHVGHPDRIADGNIRGQQHASMHQSGSDLGRSRQFFS